MAESPESAAADKDTIQVLTLKQRMAAVRRECFGIGKDNIEMESAKGAKFKIKGHTVEAVLSELRPLLDRHGLDLWPSLVERTYTGNRCDVIVDWTFERLDEGEETRVIRWGGAGTDNGDKGFSKAATNSLKEMLKKTFLITDRDDAKEEEEVIEHQTPDQVSRAQMEKAREAARANLQQWATTFKAALENAKTADDVKRLERDNKEQLSSEDLPAVTRTFFAELIERRKRELAE